MHSIQHAAFLTARNKQAPLWKTQGIVSPAKITTNLGLVAGACRAMSIMLQIIKHTVRKAILVLQGHGKRGVPGSDRQYTWSKNVARYGPNVGASTTKAYVAAKMVTFVGFSHSGTANASQYKCESKQVIDVEAAIIMYNKFERTLCVLYPNSGAVVH